MPCPRLFLCSVGVLAAAATCACAPAPPAAPRPPPPVVVVPPPELSAAPPRAAAVRAPPLAAPPLTGSAVAAGVFTVDLSAGGEARVAGGEVLSDDELGALARGAAQQPEARAVIRADAAVPYGKVIHVLDLLKQAGLTRIAFGVQAAP